MLTVKSALCAAGLVIGLGAASAGASTASLASLRANGAGAAAGPPAPTAILLCGNFMPGSDRFSGASNIDHPSGSTATGTEYPYTGQNCETENGKGGTGMFSWTISHSNV